MTHSPLRVLLVSWGFDPERQGGIARFILELAKELKIAGVDVEVWGLLGLNTDREASERQQLEKIGIRTLSFAPQKNELCLLVKVVKALVVYVRQYPRTVVSVHGALAELCAILTKCFTHTIVVRTVHSEREWYKRPLLGSIIDYICMRWLNGEIGVSSRITSKINKHRHKRKQAVWIPPISDNKVVDSFMAVTQDEARVLFNLPKNSWILGSIGRFTPQKGYDVLLKSLALLDDQNIHLALLGDGPLYPELVRQVKELNINDRVTFIKPSSKVGEFIRALNVYVSSSRWEGLSLSILEASWCGLPIIATKVSGTDDIQNLLKIRIDTCYPENTFDLVRAIRHMQRSYQHENRIHSNIEYFTSAAITEKYIEYFNRIAS